MAARGGGRRAPGGARRRGAVRGAAGRPTLDALAGRSLADALLRPFPPAGGAGLDATFAVFDAPDEDALAERGAGTCVATVLAGRLVYRRR
ncbi:hypothetical protein GCM10020295_33680 [Streptomyces cinereospinus]